MWRFSVVGTDHRGAQTRVEHLVEIANKKPTLSVTTPRLRYGMGDTVSLLATTNDPDGGPVRVTWLVREAPNLAAGAPLSTTADWTRMMTGADHGSWKLEVRATDDENESVSQLIEFEVFNEPPRIALTGRHFEIAVNQSLGLSTSVLTDDDGGSLTFAWTFRQLPWGAGTGPSLGTGSSTVLATPYGGTWILRLEVTDDDGAPNSTVREDITILVDDLPQVQLMGPSQVTPSQPWLDLHADAVDPDSPCEGTQHRCHSSMDSIARSISLGLVGYDWYVLGSPLGTGRLQDVLPVLTGQSLGADVHLNIADLQAGVWTFGVSVRDAEGNASGLSTLAVKSSPPATDPLPIVKSAPGVLDHYGYVLSNFVFDASPSFDPDNIDYAPGTSGIVAAEWLFFPPAGCPVSPFVMGGNQVLLFGVGTRLDAACTGRWTGRLSVMDDDQPPRSATVGFEFAVTSCPEGLCLLVPTTSQPIVANSAALAAPIRYVVDAYLVDRHGLATTGTVQVEINDARGSLVRHWDDLGVRLTPKATSIVTTWDGLDDAGREAPAGRYSVRLKVMRAATLLARADVDNAIILERPAFATTPATLGLQVERLGIGPISFSLSVSGIDAQQAAPSLSLELVDGLGRVVKTFTVLNGGVSWDGLTTGGSNAGGQVLPGNYLLRLRVSRTVGGWTTEVGSSVVPFPVFSLQLRSDLLGLRPAGEVPRVTVEHWLDGSLASSQFPWAKLKMMPLTLEVRRAAKVRLSASSGSVVLFESSGARLTLPHEWNASSFSPGGELLTVKLLAHAAALDASVIHVDYLDSVGATLASEALRLHPEHLRGMSGLVRATSPWITATRRIQESQTLGITLDPTVLVDRVGRTAEIHVVPHRTPAQWAASRSLVPVAPSQVTTVRGGTAKDNLLAVWGSARVLARDGDALPVSQGFDVVLDFGNFREGASFVADHQLDPCDLLLTSDWKPTVTVENWNARLFASQSDEYTEPIVVPKTAANLGRFGHLRADLATNLHGAVVTPVGVTGFPMVVLAHGMHLPRAVAVALGLGAVTTDENYLGYSYIQTFLAEHGIGSISIDLDVAANQTIFTQTGPDYDSDGIRLRSWLILKNLEWALKKVPMLAFANPDRVYLVGHSRGGQAVLDAEFLLTRAAEWPKGESLSLSAKQVHGVLALAPTSFNVTSLDVFRQVPIAIVHGTCDGDVDGVSDGVQPFLNRGARESYGLRVLGANHNFFNAHWGADDAQEDPYKNALDRPMIDVARMLGQPRQQIFAQLAVGGFVSSVEREQAWLRVPEAEPIDLYAPLAGVQVRSGAATVLDDFETGGGTMLSSSSSVVTSMLGELDEVALRESSLADETEVQNRFFHSGLGIIAEWKGQAEYTTEVPASGMDLRAARSISFRISQAPVRDLSCASSPPLSGFQLTLTDDSGWSESVALAPIGEVHASIYALASMAPICTTSATFQTIDVPLEAFTVTGKIDLSRVSRVTISAPIGRVAIDDIEVNP